MYNKQQLYNNLEKYALGLGADLFGVADISGIKDEFDIDKKTKDVLNRGISLGVRVNSLVLSEIEHHPTKLYFHHYRTLNNFLDQLALKVTNYIIKKGYLAIPIPASQIIDWQKQTAHLSHKKIGYLAGIGWQGRNNLLVNRELGSQFRLVTVLTDIPLKYDKPKDLACAGCINCVKVCPVKAIKENKEEFDYLACFEKLKEFQRQKLTNQYICGICIKACPGRAVGKSKP